MTKRIVFTLSVFFLVPAASAELEPEQRDPKTQVSPADLPGPCNLLIDRLQLTSESNPDLPKYRMGPATSLVTFEGDQMRVHLQTNWEANSGGTTTVKADGSCVENQGKRGSLEEAVASALAAARKKYQGEGFESSAAKAKFLDQLNVAILGCSPLFRVKRQNKLNPSFQAAYRKFEEESLIVRGFRKPSVGSEPASQVPSNPLAPNRDHGFEPSP